ncbi:hypothetical protein DFH07DRAFT_952651 [Mycena maculata]|uniref:Uncharacterized protein n=1 Tax=Mycena maculata TaxID=230809 RepID=A0AAD7K184_9AGAR|nr:hypothetical protein DFH07DRAFT_952651 [Mycena maculata]
MPRRGTAKRRRERMGLPPVKPGKVAWVHGTKLAFFTAQKDAYYAAVEMKEVGEFYSKMAQVYLKKYGYSVDWHEDLKEGQEVADDKIGVWYNSQFGGSVARKKAPGTSFKKLFDKKELDPPAPVKPRVLHWYSRKFYDERIKPRVVACWNAVQRAPKPPPPAKPLALIQVRNTVTREAWNAETEPFKQEVLESIREEHEVAKAAYALAVSGEAPSTAEGYNIAINNAAYYLQPFADGIHERFGMNVAIMMCGPVPDRGGRIEVRSVHSGMSNGLVPRVWSDFDRAGFDNAQRSMVEFTHHCFTEAECRARSLLATATAAGDPAGSTSGSVPATTTTPSEATPGTPDTAPDNALPGTTRTPTTPDTTPETAPETPRRPTAPDAEAEGAPDADVDGAPDRDVDGVPDGDVDGAPDVDIDGALWGMPELGVDLLDGLTWTIPPWEDAPPATAPGLDDEALLAFERDAQRAAGTSSFREGLVWDGSQLREKRGQGGKLEMRPALASELDALPPADRAVVVARPETLSEDKLEEENVCAESRRMTQLMEGGMEPWEAYNHNWSSENEEGDRGGKGKGRERAPTAPHTPTPSPGPAAPPTFPGACHGTGHTARTSEATANGSPATARGKLAGTGAVAGRSRPSRTPAGAA